MSSSAYDKGIYIWSIDTMTKEMLYRITGGGVPVVMWAPQDDRILAVSSSSIFRFADNLFPSVYESLHGIESEFELKLAFFKFCYPYLQAKL